MDESLEALGKFIATVGWPIASAAILGYVLLAVARLIGGAVADNIRRQTAELPKISTSLETLATGQNQLVDFVTSGNACRAPAAGFKPRIVQDERNAK